MSITLSTLLLATTLPGLFTSNALVASDSRTNETLVYPPWKHTLGLHRVGQTHLDLYSGYRKKFADPQGVAAVKLDFLDKEGPGDDDELTVYGINSGTGEIFYNKSLTSLGFFGKKGGGVTDFSRSVGITADRKGNVFVADRGGNRVIQLLHGSNNSLEFVRWIDLRESGRGLSGPCGVALSSASLYIADTGNDRVVVTDLSGLIRHEIGAGILETPFAVSAIGPDGWNFYQSRFLIVTDSAHTRLLKLSSTGAVLAERRFEEISDRSGGFFFVAIDYYSNIYVTDRRSGCLYKFDRNLTFITSVGCGSRARHELIEPRGIAIHRRFGQIFVAERSGASYYWVGTDVLNLSARARNLTHGEVEIKVRYHLTEQSHVTVRLDREGETLESLAETSFLAPGRIEETFVVDEAKLPCSFANCNYTLVVTARPTYSSKAYHEVERSVPVR